MNWRDEFPYLRTPAVLVTKHGKESAIAPRLRDGLGLYLETALKIDTDAFGTFTGEIERVGTPLDAARRKIEAGFERYPRARLGIASEGSFGPHAAIPFVAVGRELVLMRDRETGWEWVGHDVTPRTNYATASVTDLEAALAFAERAEFPSHRIIVLPSVDGRPAPRLDMVKDFISRADLERSVGVILDRYGAAFLQTDMRADRNPTRMRSIGRAADDLLRRFHSRCPACSFPGYDIEQWIAGLPCGACGAPTAVVETHVYGCRSCHFTETRDATDAPTADPGRCALCNP